MNSLATSAVFLLSAFVGDGVERRDAGDLRVGVVRRGRAGRGRGGRSTKRCSFTGSTKTCDAGNLHLAELDGERGAFFAGDAAGAAVGDVAGGVERAEVGADGDVAVFELEADAGGFEGAAADEVLQRVVAEQAEVAGAAAGADAGRDGDAAAADAVAGERVEVAACWPFRAR